MSPVTNLKSRSGGNVFIPTASNAFIKIVITADDATDYTIIDTYGGAAADNCTISGSFTKSEADRLGSFTLRIANDGGTFLDVFNGGEVVKIYMDVTDATTLIFYGKIDNVAYGLNKSNGFYISLDGRSYPEMIDKTITGQEIAAVSDVSLAGILNEFYTDVTLVFWNGSAWAEATYTLSTDTVSWSPAATGFPTKIINMTYQNKKGWNVIKEICIRAGLGCYMEYDGSKWTLRTFLVNTIVNSGSSVSYGTNLTNLSEFGTDNNEIINRAIVYGKTESENILLLKTENDTSSQNNLWVKDKIYNEGDIETMDEVQQKANSELAQGIITTANGRITSLSLPTIRPGELITVTVPYSNISGNYKVHSYTHNIVNPLTTSMEISKKVKQLKDLFVPTVKGDDFFTPLSNPNNMTDSYTAYFDEATTTLAPQTNTEESNGRLQLQAGQTSGTATSIVHTADNNITDCEFRVFENYQTDLDTYEVSNNNGLTWFNIVKGSTVTFTTTGKKLKFRMNLNRVATTDATPAYESVCLLYK